MAAASRGEAMRLWLRLATMSSFSGLLEQLAEGKEEGALRTCKTYLEQIGSGGQLEGAQLASLDAAALLEVLKMGLSRGLLDACVRSGLIERAPQGFRARPYLLGLAAAEVSSSLTERGYVVPGKALAAAAVRALHRLPGLYFRDEERFLLCAMLVFALSASLLELGLEEELLGARLDRQRALASPGLRRLLSSFLA